MKSNSTRLILLIALMAGVWWSLGRLDQGVEWLTVKAPREAVAGRPFPIRVSIAALEEPAFLCVHLHWSDSRDTSKGYLATGGAQRVGELGGIYDFEITVQPKNSLRFVSGVIFLSSTGSWSNQTFAAATDKIPVTSDPHGSELTLRKVPFQILKRHSGDNSAPTTIPRLIMAALFLASSLFAWMNCRSSAGSSERPDEEHRWWLALTVGLAVACVWELSGLESWLGAQARAWARAEDVYYPRALFQKGVISLACAATVVFLAFVWCQSGSYRLALIFFGLYLAISAVNLLSFHSIDQYAGLSWHGITLVEVLKLLCAGVTLIGVAKPGWLRVRSRGVPSVQ